MKSVVNVPDIGTVEYEESIWTGKKQIAINGKPLKKIDKKTFVYNNGSGDIRVFITGNFLSGAKLLIGNKNVAVTAAAKWYEILCSVLIVAFVMIWGNSVVLCSIIPIIGGGIGGAISAMFAIFNLFLMKSTKNVLLKLLIFVGMFVANFAVCFMIGFAIVSALV